MSKFRAEHRSALADVKKNGFPVTFTVTTFGTYDELTGIETPASEVSVSGHAMGVRGAPETYQRLNLVESAAPTLLFVANTYGDMTTLGAEVIVRGLIHTVRDVNPLAPDGVPIQAYVVVSR